MKNLLALSLLLVISAPLVGCVSYNKTIETKDSGAVSFPAQEEIQNKAGQASDHAGQAMDTMKNGIQQGASAVGEHAQNLTGKAGEHAENAVGTAGNAIGNMTDTLKNGAQNISGKAGQVAGNAMDKAHQLKENTAEHLNNGKEALENISGKVKGSLQSSTSTQANGIMPNLGADWRIIGSSSQKPNAVKIQQISTGQNFIAVSEQSNNVKKTIIFDENGTQQIREFSAQVQ
jgi:uncharacterized protein YjbJ (UPF0337 family)